ALTTPLSGQHRTHDTAGKPLNMFSGCGSMAQYATVSAENLIRIDSKIPLDCAALVGCGVTTGVGAVFNTAKVQPGSSVAVFGCGGVGLSAIQGARIAGAEKIIAIDTLQPKLEMGIPRRYPIAEAPQAFADLESGRNARGVVVF